MNRMKENSTKVLVVDDEPNIVELLTVSLKFQGFEVATATSGLQALEVAPEFKPDAFILDVMMPGMDGFELLPKLRALNSPFDCSHSNGCKAYFKKIP